MLEARRECDMLLMYFGAQGRGTHLGIAVLWRCILKRQSSLSICTVSWQVPDVLVILCRKIESESRRDAGDAQFLRMLHSMDDASIPLEAKWDAIAKQMSSKEEFRCAYLSQCLDAAQTQTAVVQPGRMLIMTQSKKCCRQLLRVDMLTL